MISVAPIITILSDLKACGSQLPIGYVVCIHTCTIQRTMSLIQNRLQGIMSFPKPTFESCFSSKYMYRVYNN